jgi:hypothetical protein
MRNACLGPEKHDPSYELLLLHHIYEFVIHFHSVSLAIVLNLRTLV